MKTLYFSRDYTPHDYRFLSRLAETDYDVYFMQLESSPFIREKRPIPEGITNVAFREGGGPLGPGNIFHLKRGLERVQKDLQPDLIHAGPVQRSAFLTALTGYKPLVTMSWGSDLLLDARKGLGRWAARYTLGKTTVFLCDCDAVAKVAQDLGMAEDRIVIFPWGVDLDYFSPGHDEDLRKALGWEDATVLLSTRNWEPIYGIDVLCRAFIDVSREDESAHLLLLGDGSLRDRIMRILQNSEVRGRIHIAGIVGFDELPKYYRAADLYVSASHVDGSSISLLEAMACGVPALVSDIPGNQEWVTPGLNGWRFRDGSSEALADATRDAIADLGRLRDFGVRSRKIAEERADWRKNSERLLYAYQMALSVDGEKS